MSTGNDLGIPYINSDVRYVGVSTLRQMNQEFLGALKFPVVIKKSSGTELAVLVPWEMYVELQMRTP